MSAAPWRRAWLGPAALVVATVLLFLGRGRLDKTHVALVYLLVAMGGSLVGGRRLGLLLALGAFFLFNWFFVPPYGTFEVGESLDWLVLGAFLVVSAVAAEIVHRLQDEAAAARRRAAEVDRLATVGAETLSAGRAEDALTAITTTIRTTLALADCRVHPLPVEDGDDLVTWVARNGRVALRLPDGTTRVTDATGPEASLPAARVILLPLVVRDRVVGVMEIVVDEGAPLDPDRRRFLAALSHYAALSVERARLESEAATAVAKDAVLASVSHDLRTPLTTIKAIATEMAAHGDDRAFAISEEADRLNRLVTDLLDLSRLRAGAFPIRPELGPVDELVGAALQRAGGALGGREVRVTLAEGGTLLVGRFDLGQSIRILVNLLENAHKYSAPDQPIELVAASEGDRLVISILDRGPGVPEAERERIFEPFYRRPARTPDAGSAGLGLAIARWLAEAQGGTLVCHPREGGGSRFILTLPAARLDGMEQSL